MHKHADPIEIPFSIRLEPERETCLLKIAGRKIRLNIDVSSIINN